MARDREREVKMKKHSREFSRNENLAGLCPPEKYTFSNYKVHADVSLDTSALEGQNFDLECCDLSDLAVWIDPIDATSQYIKGGQGLEEDGVPTKGLPVVTVLLGAFLKSSGRPVLGVVNQPFTTAGGGRHHWAVQTSGDADLNMGGNRKKLFCRKRLDPLALSSCKDEDRPKKNTDSPCRLVGVVAAVGKVLKQRKKYCSLQLFQTGWKGFQAA